MELYRTYGEQVQFYVVYITEAHAVDGRSPIRSGDVLVEEPVNLEERFGVAEVCATKMEIKEIPTLIDGMDNAVGAAWQGHPDRLYLVGKDGNVAYHGGRGPFGFLPDELEKAIQLELGMITEPTEAE